MIPSWLESTILCPWGLCCIIGVGFIGVKWRRGAFGELGSMRGEVSGAYCTADAIQTPNGLLPPPRKHWCRYHPNLNLGITYIITAWMLVILFIVQPLYIET